MGFFDRFSARKPDSVPANPAVPAETSALAPAPVGGVKARLLAARERLEAKDLPGAMAIYDEVLATAGDRADVLVAISGDLGTHGHVEQIIELVAPRYAADRHGPATGLNLLQAYLAVRNADAAQHVLDILFTLNRPELEDRLHGFSNAIAEMLVSGAEPIGGAAAGGAEPARIGLVTISKPVWFYGLESCAARLLPPKEGRLRRIAFAQLSLPGRPVDEKSLRAPEDELARLSRALPLWFAETFYFSALYAPAAAIGYRSGPGGPEENHLFMFNTEWTLENLRQLVETAGEGFDYVVTGALRASAGDYEMVLRVWEMASSRERKSFTARWTPGNADAALARIHGELRAYMEWSPSSAAFAYVVPTQPRPWLETLGASIGLFLAEKGIVPATCLRPAGEDLAAAAGRAVQGEAASLAFLTLQARAVRLGLTAPIEAGLARSPVVQEARAALG